MFRESSFNPFLRSSKGACGLMQVMYKVHEKMLKETGVNGYTIYHIDNNINAGCRILKDCIKKSKSISEALKRYVGGDQKSYINDIFSLMVEWELTTTGGGDKK